jgi:hypothetical protein
MRWCLIIIGVIALAVLALGAANREVPMTLADVPISAAGQLPGTLGENTKWKLITYQRDQMRVFEGQSYDLVVKSRLQNLGDGFVLRSDDWYPKNGGAALMLEERSLLWANLFTLAYRYRQPVPGYHAIFENEGWVRHKTLSITTTFANVNPIATDWALAVTMTREEEQYPDSKKSINQRSIDCSRSNQALVNAIPAVKCQIMNSLGDKTDSTSVYVKDAGIFVRQASDYKTHDGMIEKGQATRSIVVDGVDLKL